MEKVYVYRHHKLTNDEVFYVGIGVKNRPYTKWGRNEFWHKVVNKYGYKVEVVQECDSWKDACELEMFLIELYGRKDLGLGNLVNMTDGGDGRFGHIKSEETRRKMSENMKGKNLGKKHTQETKEKISNLNKGNKNMLGKKFSEETKQKMSKKKKGFLLSEEHKYNISKSNLNKKISDDDVIWIRENYKPKSKEFGALALGKRFNVNRSSIEDLVNGLTYKHLLPEKK